jgi:hypothetical protein
MTRLRSGRCATGVGVGRGLEERGDGEVVGAGSVGAGVGLVDVLVVDGTLTGVGWTPAMGGSTGMCLGLVSVTVVGGDLAGTVVVVVDGTVVVVADGTVVVVAEGTVVVVADGTVVVVAEGTVVVVADGTVVVDDGTVVGGTVVGAVVVVVKVALLAVGTRAATGAVLAETGDSTVRTLTVTQRGRTETAEARVVGNARTREAMSDATRAVTMRTRFGLLSRRECSFRPSAAFPSNGCAVSRRREASRPPMGRRRASHHRCEM